MRRYSILHDLAAPEGVPPVDQMDLAREAGEVERLLQRAVAAAHNGDLLVAEEEAVARRARADAAATKPRLAVEAQPERLRARGDDHRLCPVLNAVGPQAERPAAEVHAGDVSVDDARAEAQRLLAETAHQLRTLDPFGEAWVVLHFARDHELSAAHQATDDHRFQVRARRVHGGGQAGRTRSNDDHPGAHRFAGGLIRSGGNRCRAVAFGRCEE